MGVFSTQFRQSLKQVKPFWPRAIAAQLELGGMLFSTSQQFRSVVKWRHENEPITAPVAEPSAAANGPTPGWFFCTTNPMKAVEVSASIRSCWHGLKYVVRHQLGATASPLIRGFVLTNRCNLRCRHCRVPEPQQSREPADRQQQEQEPRSITDLEVRQAVLDTRRKHRAYFCLRATPVPDGYSMGSIEEAVIAWEITASAWEKYPEAQVGLRSQGSKRSGAQKKGKETMR